MRIHICGIYGCGKSTLAKLLSDILKIDYYSLDDIKYLIKYSKIRSVDERIKLVNEICDKKKWITEGTWSNYAENSFKKADLVILMLTNPIVCSYRIIKRYLSREKKEKDTLMGALKLIREVYRYNKSHQPVSLLEHKRLIQKHNKRVIIVKDNLDISRVISKFRNLGKPL